MTSRPDETMDEGLLDSSTGPAYCGHSGSSSATQGGHYGFFQAGLRGSRRGRASCFTRRALPLSGKKPGTGASAVPFMLFISITSRMQPVLFRLLHA